MTIRGGPPGEGAPAGAGDDLPGLLSRVAARDAAAFAALYKQTNAKLYGVVARILTRGDVAADVLQEAYVRIWEKAGDFDPAQGLAARLDGDHRPQPRARRSAARPSRFARGSAGGLRTGRRRRRSARRARTLRGAQRRSSTASRGWTRRSARSCCSPIIAARAARRSRSASGAPCRRSRPGCIAASRN